MAVAANVFVATGVLVEDGVLEVNGTSVGVLVEGGVLEASGISVNKVVLAGGISAAFFVPEMMFDPNMNKAIKAINPNAVPQ